MQDRGGMVVNISKGRQTATTVERCLQGHLGREELGAQPGGDGLFASFSDRAVLSCVPPWRRQPSREVFTVEIPKDQRSK